MEVQQYLINPSTVPPAILATAIFATALFLYHLRWRKPTTHSRGTQPPPPPEAAGAWPIIGHLHLFRGPQLLHKTLGLMADNHGPIFTIRMGIHRTLVVSSSEIAKECFTTNDKAFADRPKNIASEVLTYNYAMFGFSPYGPYWRQARKITTLELLSNHRLEALRHVRESEVKTAVKDLYDLWANNNKVSHVVGTEMKKWFNDVTLNVVFRMIVGKRYLEAMSASGDDGERCRNTFKDIVDMAGSFVVSDVIPWLRWLDLGGQEKAMRKTAIEVDRLVERWLEEHKRNRDSGEGIKDNDFMAVMLSILDGPDNFGNSTYDADTINKATALSLILAANGTTTVTMTWVLALLLNNKEALFKAQQEIDQQVGRERQVNESDLKNLVYLRAIIKETLRLYPAGPLLLPHESIQDCTVAGYHVPARTRLLVNAWKLQRDPKVWSNAEEFRPERFLSGDGKGIDVRGKSFELLPFSSGRRACPGISFALQVTELSLAALIQGFDITTPMNEPVQMIESPGLSNSLAPPLDVLLTPRLPAKAY